MATPCTVVFKIGKNAYQTDISDPNEPLSSALDRAGLDSSEIQILHKGKRITKFDMPVGDLALHPGTQVIMVLCKPGYKPVVSLTDSKNTPGREVSDAVSEKEVDPVSSCKILKIGSACADPHVLVGSDRNTRFQIHISAREGTVGQLIAGIQSELSTEGIELISAGRVFKAGDQTPVTDLKSKEFLVRRTASFWQSEEHSKARKALLEELARLKIEAQKILKSYKLDVSVNGIKLSEIMHRLCEIKNALSADIYKNIDRETFSEIDLEIEHMNNVLGKL